MATRKQSTSKRETSKKSAQKKVSRRGMNSKASAPKITRQILMARAEAAPAVAAPIAAILPSTEKSLALWYVTLRKAIGALGVALPFAVSLGASIIFNEPQQSSISSYYYTHMRDVFVGTLFAIGFFLYSYEYNRPDGIAAKIAFAFSLGVALFPTTPDENVTRTQEIIGVFHLVFAAGFFLTLSYFCLFLFTKTHPSGFPPMTPRKKQRNLLYQICGGVMLTCIVLMGVYHLAGGDDTALANLHPIYWLEAIAIVAFGISWLTKGEAILADEE